MHKKNYLTREEQFIWDYIKEKKVIDSDLIEIIFPEIDKNKKNKLLHSLYKKGYLKRIQKDLYYNPLLIDHFYELALQIHEGYIGLSSALKYYNLLDYEDFTIFIITENYRRKISLENYQIQFIPFNELYYGFEKKDELYISSIEKTLFDCLIKPSMVGFSNITKAIYNADIDWKKFLFFYKKTNNYALYQRTGYLLNIMQKNTDFKVPKFFLDHMKKRVNKRVKISSKGKKSTFNNEWKIQDNIGVENILDWWY